MRDVSWDDIAQAASEELLEDLYQGRIPLPADVTMSKNWSVRSYSDFLSGHGIQRVLFYYGRLSWDCPLVEFLRSENTSNSGMRMADGSIVGTKAASLADPTGELCRGHFVAWFRKPEQVGRAIYLGPIEEA